MGGKKLQKLGGKIGQKNQAEKLGEIWAEKLGRKIGQKIG